MNKITAAEYSGRSVRSLERLLASGRLPAKRDGRRVLVLKKDIDFFLAALPRVTPGDMCRPGTLE